MLLTAVLCPVVCTSAWAAGDNRPNIIFILADDLGCGDVACYGCRDIRTPNIDRLARQGVRFTQFYANGPECSPTRTAFLTGRYQQRVGGLECAIGTGNVGRYDDAIRLRNRDELGLPTTETTISRLLHGAGYDTAIFGKWHLGYLDKFSPNRHGFDQALYLLGGGADYFFHSEDTPDYLPVLRLNGKQIRQPEYTTEMIARRSVRYIKEPRQRPFFLYAPFTAPHAPYQRPSDRRDAPLPLDSPLWNQGKGPPEVYAAMVESLDDAVGQILSALEESHVADRTLIIFTSDNGPTASARPTAFRGLKGTTFEGGIRVPCIARWPKVLPTGTATEQPAMTIDLTASIAGAAGAEPPQDRPWDGMDVLQRLKAQQPPIARTLYWRGRRGTRTWRAVRDGDMKFVSLQNGAAKQEYVFDLKADMGEKINLLAARPDEAARLQRLLAAWEEDVQPKR